MAIVTFSAAKASGGQPIHKTAREKNVGVPCSSWSPLM